MDKMIIIIVMDRDLFRRFPVAILISDGIIYYFWSLLCEKTNLNNFQRLIQIDIIWKC